MQFENWKTETVTDILPEEFYELIDSNREHIRKTFPVTLSNCLDLESTRKFITDKIGKERVNEGYYFYLRHLESQKLIGYLCIKTIDLKIMKCELAYFIDTAFEGKGIVSKAIVAVITYCFETLKMNKVFICTSRVNAASQRIATKQGFKQEGILRSEFKNGDGILEDIVYFGLLKSEWNER